MDASQQLDEIATQDEIFQAFESLTDADLYRLKVFAAKGLPRTEYRTDLEIIQEALVRALNGTEGGEGKFRRWRPKKAPFLAFMVMTIRGLIDDSRNTIQQRLTMHLEGMVPDGGDTEAVLGLLGHRNPDPLTQLLELEDAQKAADQATADLAKIEAFFADDDQVRWIIMGRKDELPPAEIRVMAGMSQTEYETALKRLSRGLKKLFPERRKS